jgi:uncharacterized protein involved in exopolysaccharide biosynthesis
MEDEIDLRVYINTLLRYKWVILGVTLIAGVAAYIFISLQPPTYQAKALVAITRPLYQFQFTPNILNLTDKEAAQQFTGKAGVELANSDAILRQVLDAVGPNLKPEERTLAVLREKIKATTSSDPSILVLSATNANPQTVAALVNTAVDLYVRYVNDLYGQSFAQEKFFEKQLSQARNDLDKAEQAATEFQKRNNSSILNAELTTKQSTFSGYLGLNESLKILLQNIRALKDQLSRQPAGNLSTLGEDIAALSLQISTSTASMPIQLQLPNDGSNLSRKTNSEQAAYLAELSKTIEAKLIEIRKQIGAMPSTILMLQGQLQKVNTEMAQLNRQRDIAQNVFTALAQKAGETRITARETSGRVRVASYASVPDKPIGGRLQKTAIALMLGFFLSVFGVFIIEYFRKPQTDV